MSDYRDPTPEELERPEFEAVWQAIKAWDLSRGPGEPIVAGDVTYTGAHRLYAGASGNDVVHILDALAKAGLHIVTEADKRVLKECARAEIEAACHRGIQCCARFKGTCQAYVCAAELARRGVSSG